MVDTVGLDDEFRARLRHRAAEAGLPCVAVGFDTDARLCHQRNAERANPLPRSAIDRQLRRWRAVRPGLATEGFDRVLVDPGPARPVAALADLPTSPSEGGHRIRSERPALAFDLVVSSYEFGGDNAEIGPRLTEIAQAAEAAGFRALQVMDHFRQVPQVGRAWEPMLECFTTLAFVAARTATLRVGPLVAGVEHRNVGLLAKIVATLDVLSGGRAECGVGAGWFSTEQAAYGYPVHSDRVRLDTLEEALKALPVLWGPGSKSFEGTRVSIPEAMAYPRPLQDPVPLLVGGGGERRTLRLAARHADAANVVLGAGDERAMVARKIEVLRRHCAEVERDPDEVAMTVLAPLVHAATGAELVDLIERLRPRNRSAEAWASANRAGTTDEVEERFRALSALGVERASIALTGNDGPERVAAFGQVIERFA